ncbi:phage head closure protein [Limosilactobacillus sp. STM2_1]|uniref:Phage head closure protein n=1 Tax=Limosilactobacillus rudii TaxID=2759755 RepID=A0A7W3UL53_9LACO|nr:phage head closure protein [Limosilactobacillus rudii]MBB1079065.1 phage head closure protein [Limosilactobacillus rudii]MBB1097060.1 phage head closure protein [Limosilactobacillus rudii]MCD7134028.1 phage head closure protein [Limosilactobacillus rudii]
MVKNLNVARMRYRLEFGIDESTGKKNPNTGKAIKGFNPHFTRYAGLWTLNANQAITLAGANIKEAVVFFIRHDLQITSNYKIRKGDEIFIIDNISYDDGLSTDGFDLITCHREVVKHG